MDELCLSVSSVSFNLREELNETRTGAGRDMITRDNLRFARQAGVTHVVLHPPTTAKTPTSCPPAPGAGRLHRCAAGVDLRRTARCPRHGQRRRSGAGSDRELRPAFWYDVLLDGPRKQQQIERPQADHPRHGQGGHPVMGYNFSIAGVWGRRHDAPGARRRGRGARSRSPEQPPIPNGMVWNMVYDPDATQRATVWARSRTEQLWQRLTYFLQRAAAGGRGGRRASGRAPDDPPMPTLRGTPGWCTSRASTSACSTSCPARQQARVLHRHAGRDDRRRHLRCRRPVQPRGQSPTSTSATCAARCRTTTRCSWTRATLDMIRVLRILHRNGYDGVIIPDHTPEMTCAAPWHAGMAFRWVT